MVIRNAVSSINAIHFQWIDTPNMEKAALLLDNKEISTQKYSCATTTKGVYVSVADIRNVLMNSHSNTFIFERIWIKPTEINAKLIVASQTYDISIWNAYQRDKKVLSNINIANQDGTSLVPIVLPYTLQPTSSLTAKINIHKIGPFLQNTTYFFIIDDSYPVKIKGVRVLTLPEIANFESQIEVVYQYDTSVFQTDRLKEQRRMLREKPVRTLKGMYLVNEVLRQKFINKLIFGHDKLFAVPIMDEPLRASAITKGASSVSISHPLNNYYNLNNNCEYIMIISNHEDSVEIHKIESIVGTSINLQSKIENDFIVQKTTIYPVFFGIVRTGNIDSVSADIASIAAEFQEMRISNA